MLHIDALHKAQNSMQSNLIFKLWQIHWPAVSDTLILFYFYYTIDPYCSYISELYVFDFVNLFIMNFIALPLQTDLEHIFNWNAKELFLYLSAEYTTSKNKVNQVVLWDKIIRRGESAKLNYKSMNTKYYFWDDGLGLRGNENITLTLSWNVIPNAGRLDIAHGKEVYRFAFPKEYLPSRLSS